MYNQKLLESAKALAEAFNRDWIIDIHKTILKTYEEMVKQIKA